MFVSLRSVMVQPYTQAIIICIKCAHTLRQKTQRLKRPFVRTLAAGSTLHLRFTQPSSLLTCPSHITLAVLADGVFTESVSIHAGILSEHLSFHANEHSLDLGALAIAGLSDGRGEPSLLRRPGACLFFVQSQ